jgi:hypothetical protein
LISCIEIAPYKTMIGLAIYFFPFDFLLSNSKRRVSENCGNDDVATRIVEFLRIERVDWVIENLLVKTIHVDMP